MSRKSTMTRTTRDGHERPRHEVIPATGPTDGIDHLIRKPADAFRFVE